LDVRLSAEGERLRINAPKGAITSALREEISLRKREILQLLRERAGDSAFLPPPIRRARKDQPSRLSFAQERLWFLNQFEGGSSVYNVCRATCIGGQLKTEALELGLREIVRRHEILRSTFQVVDGQPVQIAAPAFKLSIPRIDLRPLSNPEREGKVVRLLAEEASHPFELSSGPLLRGTLLRLNKHEHILILTTHHIVSDAWSMGILGRELWSLYQAYSSGKSAPLTDLPFQYSDFAVWQREWLSGEPLQTQLAYWKKQLDEISFLNLPTDRPRSAQQNFHGARQTFILAESLTTAIKELSGREAVTPFMTLLAAFQTLLCRYSGQEDVIVGSPVANRNRPELEGLIGFFVNTLALRTDLSGNPTFKELISRVRDVCFGAFAHRDLPFEKLVEELRPERDLSRNPLFQVMFVLQNTPRALPQVTGLTIERMDIQTVTSPFDLSLYLRERDGKFVGFFEYSTDLFEGARVQRMIGHFQTVLEAIVSDADQSIATLPMLTEAERHQILIEWNGTAADYPKDSCVHELFEGQAARTPESIAVQFEDKQLTYWELNQRANQLAHYLRGAGVGPEKFVGICVERSLEMVVGLLGILKAGGAYVPLDPTHPAERLFFMLEDAQVSVFLTQEKLLQSHQLSAISSQEAFTVVCVDRDRKEIEQQSARNPPSRVGSDNLAYVIYTSGSTGQPKGVQINHRSLINCLFSMCQQSGMGKKQVFLAVTTIAFDIASLELYLPLMAGAKLVLASRDEILDGRDLLDRLKKSRTTAMQATPSGWRLLLDAGWKRRKNFKIFCGGEILSRRFADQLLEGGPLLWNLYGPTETTIWSTSAKVQRSEGPVVIGRPIANTQIYILDSHLQPVPAGVYGELYVGGDGLARSYLNRPELTAERFVPNSFSQKSGSRLYRTGDVARHRVDGNIEFLGRADNQVKIRGCRIELGEIEAILNQHPAVSESVVVARNDLRAEPRRSDNQKSKIDSSRASNSTLSEVERIENPEFERRLIAYLVPTTDNFTVGDLDRYLREKLPQYMIPSQLVILDALPLVANGKVDRQKLPTPCDARPQLRQEFIAPRTEIEELIAQILKDVLKVQNIGLHDNFFDLGGHSLLATQVLTNTRDIFRKDVSLREFFEEPTIGGLVAAVEKAVVGKHKIHFRSVVRVPSRGAFPLSSSQRQLWTLDQLLPGTFFLNMPYAYRLNGLLDVKVLRNALQEIIKRHEAFHLIFGERRGRPVQFVGKIPQIELPIADLRRLPPNERDREFEALSKGDAGLPFDLEEGPLIRVQLVRLGDEEHILLVTVHHIICDNWSLQVFRQELAVLYEEYSHGRPTPLPEVSMQFIDFVCWQREALRRGFFREQLAYWKKHLSGRVPMLEFQKHGKRQRRLSFRTATRPIEIDAAILRRLRTFASQEHSTSFIFLLAVLDLILYRYTRKQDIWVGTTVANRNQKGSENVIGNCLNVVILRAQIFPELTFTQFLQRVRDTAIAAMTHQDLPFGQVASAVAKENVRLKGAPLFQVMFIYQKRTYQPIKLPGLTIASLEGSYRRPEPTVLLTRLDLIFEVRESLTKLTASVTYKTHEIGDQVASEMAKDFREIAERVLHDPNQRVRDIIDSCLGRLSRRKPVQPHADRL
jgi:amino acid adenylation domain-containing protein